MDDTFVLDDTTALDALDELATLATIPTLPTVAYHDLPDTFEWAADGALSYR